MEVRSHEIQETAYTTVPSKYVIVTHKKYFYVVPEECVDGLDVSSLLQYSVLTINTETEAIVKSRFF